MTPEQAKAILEPKIFIVEDLPHDDKVILYEDAIDLLSEHSALKEQEVVGYLIEGISDTLKGFHELTDKPERFKGQPENFKVTPLVKK